MVCYDYGGPEEGLAPYDVPPPHVCGAPFLTRPGASSVAGSPDFPGRASSAASERLAPIACVPMRPRPRAPIFPREPAVPVACRPSAGASSIAGRPIAVVTSVLGRGLSLFAARPVLPPTIRRDVPRMAASNRMCAQRPRPRAFTSGQPPPPGRPSSAVRMDRPPIAGVAGVPGRGHRCLKWLGVIWPPIIRRRTNAPATASLTCVFGRGQP